MFSTARCLFLTCCLLLCAAGSAQNETRKWYFGANAALDFATSPPTVINGSAMWALEGCASAADAAGNLLFYTHGQTIWNQQNVPMANGTGLLGGANSSTSQGALIIKQPGNANLYFVFTLDAWGGTNGLQYSIVDMGLAAGMGSVTVKNVPLYAPSAEKMSATRHCNGTDVWIVTHDWNSSGFRAYLLTAAGVNTTAVISTIGSYYAPTAGGVDFEGSIKFSPNGKKLAVAITGLITTPVSSLYMGWCELFDFDNATGVISNSISLGMDPGGYYGCEFSPDGTKLYTSFGKIYQWDLAAGTAAAIAASAYTVSNPNINMNTLSLQLAPDGKIYVANGFQQWLGVINNPNSYGSACNYSVQLQSIGTGTCNFGLPNFMCSYFKGLSPAAPFTYTNNAATACLGAAFTANSFSFTSPTPTLVTWSFGDPASGAANSSTLMNPSHIYPAPGTYTVQLIRYNNCSIDTLIQPVTITAYVPIINIAGSFTNCAGQSQTFTLSGAGSYSLNGAATASILSLNPPASTVYAVAGNNGQGGCIGMASINLVVLPTPATTINGITNICSGDSTTLTANGANSYNWSTGASNAVIAIGPLTNTVYTVTGINTANGCSSTAQASITVSQKPVLNLITNNTVTCVGNPVTAQVSGAATYSWSTGATASVVSLPPQLLGMNVYTVTGFSASGCAVSATAGIVVYSCLGIEQLIANGGVDVYPNPSQGFITIESVVWMKVSIYNETGALMVEKQITPGKNNIDLSGYSDGIYLLRYNNSTLRLLLERR